MKAFDKDGTQKDELFQLVADKIRDIFDDCSANLDAMYKDLDKPFLVDDCSDNTLPQIRQLLRMQRKRELKETTEEGCKEALKYFSRESADFFIGIDPDILPRIEELRMELIEALEEKGRAGKRRMRGPMWMKPKNGPIYKGEPLLTSVEKAETARKMNTAMSLYDF